MTTYLINTNGNDMGVWEADSEIDALLDMLADACPGVAHDIQHQDGDWLTAFPMEAITDPDHEDRAKAIRAQDEIVQGHYEITEVTHIPGDNREAIVAGILERLGDGATLDDAEAMYDLGRLDCAGQWYIRDWDEALAEL